MAAAPVSQPKCIHCSQVLNPGASPHFCLSCGFPLPVHPSEDYFSAFGVPRRFHLDLAELEKKFYAFSRALHPDRFSTASTVIRGLSIERMSFVNQAYGTLKKPALLRDYLLRLEGVLIPQQRAPMDLAERWFEIQDLLAEGSIEGTQKRSLLEKDLRLQQEEVNQKLLALESSFDLDPEPQILEELARQIQTQSYLVSLNKDLERTKKNAHSTQSN